MTRYKHLIVTFFLFLFIFTVYFGSSTVGSTDSMWSIHTSISLIKEGNLDINEYLPIIKARNNYAIENIGGKIYTFFPKGVSIISLPIVYLLSVFVEDRVLIANAEIVENICASFFTALTSILVFYFGRYYKLSTTKAVFLSLLFSFCTSSWSTTSRCLWMHGPSMFFLALALYIILQAKEKNSYLIQFASIPLAFSYLIRPTNSISILVFSVYTFLYYRKFFIKYSIYGALIGFLFFAHSYSVYGKFLPPYYSATKLQFDTDLFFTALTGNLISPARGLFVWSSIFLFIFLGIYYKYKEEKIDPIYHSIIIIILFHWIAISTFPHWWAGHSVGYRFMSDMVPYLFIFLIPIVRRVFEHRSMSLTICFLLASLISFYFHYQGANNSEIALWNVIP